MMEENSPTIAAAVAYQYLEASDAVADLHNSANSPNIEVSGEDCLLIAKKLSKEGKTPCVLNMANQFHVGGDYLSTVSGGQEEYLIRNTDLLSSLKLLPGVRAGTTINPFKYDVENTLGFFNNHQKTGFGEFCCLFSEKITHNNDPKNNLNIISSAAYNLSDFDNRPEYNFYIAGTVFKIINQLRVAKKHGQRNLILGAFGCGAFANNPEFITELYHAAINESEFNGCFDSIYFAIKHKNLAEKNIFMVFTKEFQKNHLNRSLTNILSEVQKELPNNQQLQQMISGFLTIDTERDRIKQINNLIQQELNKLDPNMHKTKFLFVNKIKLLIQNHPEQLSTIMNNLPSLEEYKLVEYGRGIFKNCRYKFIKELENMATNEELTANPTQQQKLTIKPGF